MLGDPERRREYDEARRLRAAGPIGDVEGFSFRFDGAEAADGFGFAGFDLDDLLGDLLSGGRAGSPGSARNQPRRGADLVADLDLPFEDAVRGTTTTVVVSDVPGRPGRTVKARVPAGVDDGQTIRLPGRGSPGNEGGPPGELLLRVRVRPHWLFGRRGRDLTVTVPVTFPEAALGADVTVPTLDGPVTLRVPPGTPSGRTLRVRGRGVPAAGPGDLLVTVEVAVPRELTDRQRRAVEELAAALEGESPQASLGV